MNWNDKTAIRILLFVAKMVASESWRKEIDQLAAHISCWAPKEAAKQ